MIAREYLLKNWGLIIHGHQFIKIHSFQVQMVSTISSGSSGPKTFMSSILITVFLFYKREKAMEIKIEHIVYPCIYIYLYFHNFTGFFMCSPPPEMTGSHLLPILLFLL